MASAKHFINDPQKLLAAALKAAPVLNPNVSVDEKNKIVYNEIENPKKLVSIISGGGAGHEPSFVSYVGPGLLDAAVSGNIFASPSPAQIYAAILGVDRRNNTGSKAGKNSVLMIIMNYTGDVLNFGLAAEKANAMGINVDVIVVGDDVGVGKERSGKVGRRGIAGTVLMHKLAGAMAEAGLPHDEIKDLVEKLAKCTVSVGASLSHVHVPGHDVSESSLGANEIEIGMGIHNEQGSMTIPIPEFPNLVKLLLKQLLDEQDEDRNYLKRVLFEDKWVLMLNNLGGVSPLEMAGITTEVLNQLEQNWRIKPLRVYNGTFMTSLNGNGFSITLAIVSDRILEYLDAEARAFGTPSSMHFGNWFTVAKPVTTDVVSEDEEIVEYVKSGLIMDLERFIGAVKGGLHNLIAAEKDITKYDELVGDGDCGICLRRGAEAVLGLLDSGTLDNDAVVAMQKVAEAIEGSMDGTSGALYCIYFISFSTALRRRAEQKLETLHGVPATLEDWYLAAIEAEKSLHKYTPAQPGDRTLVDALHPFLRAMYTTGANMKAAVEAAKAGAESTRKMKAKLGRTVYVGNVGDVPDPGAIGVYKLLEGMSNVLGDELGRPPNTDIRVTADRSGA